MELNPHQLYQLHRYLQAASRQCGLCVQRSLLLHDKRLGVRVCAHEFGTCVHSSLLCRWLRLCVQPCTRACVRPSVVTPSEPLSHTHSLKCHPRAGPSILSVECGCRMEGSKAAAILNSWEKKCRGCKVMRHTVPFFVGAYMLCAVVPFIQSVLSKACVVFCIYSLAWSY